MTESENMPDVGKIKFENGSTEFQEKSPVQKAVDQLNLTCARLELQHSGKCRQCGYPDVRHSKTAFPVAKRAALDEDKQMAMDWIDKVIDHPDIPRSVMRTIRAALVEDDHELVKQIEGMKMAMRHYAVGGTPEFNNKVAIYNQAIDDVLQALAAHRAKQGE